MGEGGGVRVPDFVQADMPPPPPPPPFPPPPPPLPGRRYAIDDFICCFFLFRLCLVSPM